MSLALAFASQGLIEPGKMFFERGYFEAARAWQTALSILVDISSKMAILFLPNQ